MNPIGDETGILVLFGLCALIVLAAAYRLRTRRYPIAAGALAGLLCGAGLYAVLALITLALHGTRGDQFASWLVIVGVSLIPAGVVGLVEGFVASLIFRLLA